MAENNTERTKRKHRSEEKERTERKYRSEEKERIEKRDGTDGMQMGAIDETLLVRRTGGKNKTTQLSRGDPEIVPDVRINLLSFFAYLFYRKLFRNHSKVATKIPRDRSIIT